jgi:hypothetical protein
MFCQLKKLAKSQKIGFLCKRILGALITKAK